MLTNRLILGLLVAFSLLGGLGSQGSNVEETPLPREYYYRFESPTFDIELAELWVDHNNQGEFRFRRKSEEKTVKLQLRLLPQTVKRIDALLRQASFFTGNEDYQGDRDLSHLGVTTIRVRQGTRQRQVSFTYTRHPAMRELAGLFRNLVTQESRVFAIELARQYSPLDLDRQLSGMQREVKNGWVAEPEKLIPLLEEIEADDGILLIARRRAGEILRLIKKR